MMYYENRKQNIYESTNEYIFINENNKEYINMFQIEYYHFDFSLSIFVVSINKEITTM